jgi:hypothetical protein
MGEDWNQQEGHTIAGVEELSQSMVKPGCRSVDRRPSTDKQE